VIIPIAIRISPKFLAKEINDIARSAIKMIGEVEAGEWANPHNALNAAYLDNLIEDLNYFAANSLLKDTVDFRINEILKQKFGGQGEGCVENGVAGTTGNLIEFRDKFDSLGNSDKYQRSKGNGPFFRLLNESLQELEHKLGSDIGIKENIRAGNDNDNDNDNQEEISYVETKRLSFADEAAHHRNEEKIPGEFHAIEGNKETNRSDKKTKDGQSSDPSLNDTSFAALTVEEKASLSKSVNEALEELARPERCAEKVKQRVDLVDSFTRLPGAEDQIKEKLEVFLKQIFERDKSADYQNLCEFVRLFDENDAPFDLPPTGGFVRLLYSTIQEISKHWMISGYKEEVGMHQL